MPESLKGALQSDVVDVLTPVVPGARWTRREGRHLTLRFLGEVADDRVPSIEDALSGAAARHARFDAAFAEVGGFPSMRRPRVLWVGIGPGREPMAALAGSVEDALHPLGFASERRPFAAHLTLARFKVPSRLGDLPVVNVPEKSFAVEDVVLFRSQLHPKGARYTALARFPLGS